MGRGRDHIGCSPRQGQVEATRKQHKPSIIGPEGEKALVSASRGRPQGDLHRADQRATPTLALTSCVILGEWLNLCVSDSLSVNIAFLIRLSWRINEENTIKHSDQDLACSKCSKKGLGIIIAVWW